MVRRRHYSALAVGMILLLGLVACAPSIRARAVEAAERSVETSVQALMDTLQMEHEGPLTGDTISDVVARYDLSSGIEIPATTAGRTLYCLEQDEKVVTFCLFYPVLVDTFGTLGQRDARVYGCLEYEGVLGTTELTATDVECPAELVAWFERHVRAGERVDTISLAAVANAAIHAVNNPEPKPEVCYCYSGSPCRCPGG